MAETNRVTQEEYFSDGSGFIELRGFVGEDFARRTVFAGDFEGVGALLPGRV